MFKGKTKLILPFNVAVLKKSFLSKYASWNIPISDVCLQREINEESMNMEILMWIINRSVLYLKLQIMAFLIVLSPYPPPWHLQMLLSESCSKTPSRNVTSSSECSSSELRRQTIREIELQKQFRLTYNKNCYSNTKI